MMAGDYEYRKANGNRYCLVSPHNVCVQQDLRTSLHHVRATIPSRRVLRIWFSSVALNWSISHSYQSISFSGTV
jgi:hypothetical protein